MPWQALKNALGLSDGGGVRGALDQLKESFGFDATGSASASSGVAFTIAVVALAAKMSKADGVSTDIEAHAFEQQFAVPPEDLANVRRLYALASQDVAGFEAYAAQISRMLADEPDLKLSVLECLFHIASADGVLHPAEDDYLHHVAQALGVSECEFSCVRRAFVSDPDNPYEILNVAPNAPIEEIKSRYRELVKSHHPDLLVAKGVPPELLAAAGRRLAAITAAYEAIQHDRGARGDRALETSAT
ncbi:MAG: TerB family tellurite resistance protein [Hyphomicrobium sp.]